MSDCENDVFFLISPLKQLLNMRLNREILRLSLPAIVSNITVPLLGLSDTAISGHLGSPVFIGAIAVASMMLNVAFWLFGFLRMGTTGLTAEAFGAGDMARSASVLVRSVGIAFMIGVLLILFRGPLSEVLLDFVGADPGVRALAKEYYLLCIFGAPALLATMSFNGWFVGMQSTFTSMVVSISVNVINIGLSLWFVFGLDMGFIGVGRGTLYAQWAGLAIAFIMFLLFCRKEQIRFTFKDSFHGDIMRFFRVNSDLFFRSACIMLVSMSVTAAGARMGGIVLAANAVMMQFFVFFSYFMDGFAFAAEALTGRFSGAGDMVMMKKSIRALLLWSAGMAFLFLSIYILWLKPIAAFITDQREVVAAVIDHRIYVCLIPVLTVAAFIFDGFYIGLTRTRAMLVCTFAGAVIFFVVSGFSISLPSRGAFTLADALIPPPGNSRLWGGFLSYLAFRGISLACLLPYYLRKSRSSVAKRDNI